MIKRLLSLTAMVGVLLGGMAAPAMADASTANADDIGDRASWDCSGGGEYDADGRWNIVAYCERSDRQFVLARFYPHDELLYVYDSFDNDRATVARLWVSGYGEAEFKTGPHNRSYPENLAMSLRVCTSSSSNAVCSRAYSGKT